MGSLGSDHFMLVGINQKLRSLCLLLFRGTVIRIVCTRHDLDYVNLSVIIHGNDVAMEFLSIDFDVILVMMPCII